MRFRSERFIDKALGERGCGGVETPDRIDMARLRLFAIGGERNEALINAAFALGIAEIRLHLGSSGRPHRKILIPYVGDKLIERLVVAVDGKGERSLVGEDNVENFVFVRFLEALADGLLDVRIEFFRLKIIGGGDVYRADIARRDGSFFDVVIGDVARITAARVIYNENVVALRRSDGGEE